MKPNHGKVANQFDEELVQEQLRYNGILEISYIRNQGWPVRYTFDEFFQRFVDPSFCRVSGTLLASFRYKFISYPQSTSTKVNAASCERILKDLSLTEYVIGKSKVRPLPHRPRIIPY